MGEVIRLDYARYWRQVYVHDGQSSVLEVYVNEATKEIEVVQLNDDNESIRTCLGNVDTAILLEALNLAMKKTRA